MNAFETDTHDRFMRIEKRLDDGNERMQRIEEKVDAQGVKTDEVYEIIIAAKGFFKVLGWIGKGVKWLTIIGGAITGVYAAVTHIKG